eukprot:jgi/Astpho2/4814/Aster-07514
MPAGLVNVEADGTREHYIKIFKALGPAGCMKLPGCPGRHDLQGLGLNRLQQSAWLPWKVQSVLVANMSRTTQVMAGEAILPYDIKTSKRVRASEAQQDGCAAARLLLRAGEDEISSEGVTGPKSKKPKDGSEWCHSDDKVVVRVRDNAVAERLEMQQAVLEGLASQEVLALSVAIQARIISGKPGNPKRKRGFAKVFDSHVSVFEAFRNTIGLDPELDIKGTADDNYYQRNTEVHGDDAHLRRWARRLCKQKYVALVKGEHPWPCALIEHFDLVEKKLFKL